MSSLLPCPACRRHIRSHEPRCCFCGAERAPHAEPVRQITLPRDVKRATLFALGLTLAGQACADENAVAVYGAPFAPGAGASSVRAAAARGQVQGRVRAAATSSPFTARPSPRRQGAMAVPLACQQPMVGSTAARTRAPATRAAKTPVERQPTPTEVCSPVRVSGAEAVARPEDHYYAANVSHLLCARGSWRSARRAREEG